MKIRYRFVITLLIILIGLMNVSSLVSAQCNRDLVIYGSTSGGAFGSKVTDAGDVNNDNYDDILVITPSGMFIDAKATVFSGLDGELIRTYYDNVNNIQGASSFGDYDNDGNDDILINGVVYSGINGDTLTNFGWVFANGISIGDANGDNISDLVTSVTNPTRVYLISGATKDTLQTWSTSSYWPVFDAAGDFNNDGYADIIIGDPDNDGLETNAGRVVVYSGFDGSQLFARFGMTRQGGFGTTVSGAGDLNNDGYDDVLVAGVTNTYGSGEVWAYSGKTGGLLHTLSQGAVAYKFGFSMDGIGDVSNDGYDDFVIGSPNDYYGFGNAYVYSGKTGLVIFEIGNPVGRLKEGLGSSVAGVGDTDGDGTLDFVASCPGYEYDVDPDNPDPENVYHGAVYVFDCIYPSLECQGNDDFDEDLWDNVCDNCKWFKNGEQLDLNSNGLGDMCEDTEPLLAGNSSYVILGNMQGLTYNPQLTFDTVLVEGQVYFSISDFDESENLDAIPVIQPMKYSFSTDAIFGGNITVKLPYLDTTMTPEIENELQLYQKINGNWINITTIGGSSYFNTIVGEAYSLGEFAIGGCGPVPDTDADGISDLCDNCRSISNPDQEDLNNNFIGDACETTQTLTTGSDVQANLEIGDETVYLNFDSLEQAGEIDLSISSNGPAAESGFVVFPADAPIYYNISTDALYSGVVRISFYYDDTGLSLLEESHLGLWHYDGISWVDITTMIDVGNNVVWGETTSLSPFALGLQAIPTAVDDEVPNELPTSFILFQNHPNPFNPETEISFELPKGSQVKLEVFNVIGQLVTTLSNEFFSAGLHTVTWDASKKASGIYLYRLTTNEFVETKKMILLK